VDSARSYFELIWNERVQYEKLKEYERLKAYSKMQTEFINSAAHELRTPIQPILSMGEILRFRNRKELNESLDIILRNARRLRDLADNILNVSLIESQSLKLEKELFNLNDIITDNIEKVKKQFLLINDDNSSSSSTTRLKMLYSRISRGVEGTTDGIYVEADKRRLSQVVYNLLNNAIKFTNKEGSIAVIVDERKDNDEKNIVIVSIKDTGAGIDPEIFPNLFSKFTSKSSAGGGEAGADLGLCVCKGIIEKHGGKIWAENNTDGKGATFYFSLPLRKEQKRIAI
jgi:two-component system, OmpR family, sensor histidine kinase VicK